MMTTSTSGSTPPSTSAASPLDGVLPSALRFSSTISPPPLYLGLAAASFEPRSFVVGDAALISLQREYVGRSANLQIRRSPSTQSRPCMHPPDAEAFQSPTRPTNPGEGLGPTSPCPDISFQLTSG